MKKPDLAAVIAEQADFSKAIGAEVLNVILDEIGNAMARGESVNLPGFGSFSPSFRQARSGVNPQTGDKIQIPASKNVSFKAGKGLKEAVNQA